MSKASYKLSDEFRNDSIYLLVGDTVYVVNHRVLLGDSEFFKKLLELPSETDRPVEGTSAENPLRIEGVDEEEFKLWLRAMFPRYASDSREITSQQWMAVLKFLVMWDFTISTKNVLDTLRTSADPITKILIFERYHDTLKIDVEAWLKNPLLSLVERSESLSEQEAVRLGASITAKIARIREKYCCCCPIRATKAQVSTHRERNCTRKGWNGFGDEAHEAFPDWIVKKALEFKW